MSAVDILMDRLLIEEGTRMLPYDDATGLPVRAPKGNLTWGRGFNLMKCGSPALFDAMERCLLTALDTDLLDYPFYANAGDVRASVFLDIVYNGGEKGELLGYPHMIAAASEDPPDWPRVAANCTNKDPKLDASRYAPLRALLLSG